MDIGRFRTDPKTGARDGDAINQHYGAKIPLIDVEGFSKGAGVKK